MTTRCIKIICCLSNNKMHGEITSIVRRKSNVLRGRIQVFVRPCARIYLLPIVVPKEHRRNTVLGHAVSSPRGKMHNYLLSLRHETADCLLEWCMLAHRLDVDTHIHLGKQFFQAINHHTLYLQWLSLGLDSLAPIETHNLTFSWLYIQHCRNNCKFNFNCRLDL